MTNNDIILSGTWHILETGETINGTLTMNEDKKIIILKLVAVADEENPMPRIKACGRTMLIKGDVSTGGTITLYDCRLGGPHMNVGQRTEVTVTAKYAFWNLEVESVENLVFSKMYIDFGEIIEWTDLCYFNWDNDYDSEPVEYQLKWIYKPESVISIRDGLSLKIAPRLGSQKMIVKEKEMTVKQSVQIVLDYRKPEKFEIILEDIRTLNSLLTLAMNRAVYIDEIYYAHESNWIEEYKHIREMKMYMGDFREGRHSHGSWWEYLFELKDLTSNQNECFNNWYKKYDRLQPVIELYESAYNFQGISGEILFLNLAQALETYHARFISNKFSEYETMVENKLRDIYKIPSGMEINGHAAKVKAIMIAQDRKNVIHLKSRLGYLFLGDWKIVFEFLDYSMEEFIQKTLDSRNYYTHYAIEKKDKVFPKEELPYVNGILMGILQFYILKEIGIDEEKILEKVSNTMGSISRSYAINKGQADLH